MAIFDIYSKRQQRTAGSPIDVFEYENIPATLRNQVIFILQDLIGDIPNMSISYEVYKAIHDALAREYGIPRLAADNLEGNALFTFIRKTSTSSQVLDAVEVSFHIASRKFGNAYTRGHKISIDEAGKELNQRFLEAGIGYQYVNRQIIRVDSQFLHAEAVKPALVLLADPRYHGAQEEFLKAHKNYRDGDYKGCLIECLKSFESTMKTICELRKWAYQKTDTAKTLINVCLTNGLIPAMLQAQLSALQNLLESGVPTLRNKNSGHGQGSVPTTVPPDVAAYSLHLTAANIVLFVNSERALP